MRFSSLVRALAAPLVLALLPAVASAQLTWYVDDDGTAPGSGTPADPFPTIQAAIDYGMTGTLDRIEVAAGTYVENLDVHKGLEIVGAGADRTFVLAAGPGPAVRSASFFQVRLEGLTIAGGTGPDGHGVDVISGSSTFLTSCVVRDNEGNGVSNDYDTSINKCTVTRNGGHSVFTTTFPNGINLTHSIVVDNGLPPDFGSQIGFVKWNIIDQGNWGDVAGDPALWNAPADDFRLRPESPAIDSGSPAPQEQDPDGSRADLGAFPFDPAWPPAPTTYCTAKVNSQGCTPQVAFTGTPSASGAPFTITCSQVLNDKFGLLFYGYGPKAVPFQGGWLCVRGPVRRTALQSSGGNPPPDDCSGVYLYDFDARIQSGADPVLALDAGVYAQYWFRDPLSVSGFTTGRSDAIYFWIGP